MTDTTPTPTTDGETYGNSSGGTAFKHANTKLHALNLFSGPYRRSDGLPPVQSELASRLRTSFCSSVTVARTAALTRSSATVARKVAFTSAM